ncbi:MAG: hypothetical protein FJ272_05475 [Planctomycetes bacterium]|nr:hypothetical protein [Planctomycetota bacterium]
MGIQAQDWTIEDVAARVVQTAQGLTAQVRWTTKAPTKGKVEYGDAASLGQVAEEDPSSLRGSTNARDSGRGFANNHRADIRWPAYKPFHFRIRATDAASKEVVGEPGVVPTPTMPAGGAASAGRIPLKVDRGAWKVDAPPVVAGVPFPRGVLFLANAAYVVADNEPIPCQTEAVSRYDDGSICWLRVAFQAPQVGKGVALDYGARIAQAGTPEHAAVKVEGKAFQVSSGLVSIAARADGTGTLKLGQATVPLPRGVLVDKDGTSFPATPEAVTLEEHGAVRTVIRVDGHHRSADGKAHFAYVMRLYAFAGKDYVRCDYTFANDMTAQEMTAFRQLNLRFAGLTAPLVVNGDLKLTDGQRVLQREDNEWVLEPGERKGERLTGEAECGGVRVMLRQCWQQYPKSFAAERDGLVVGLCPALPTGFYAGRKDEDKLYYYLRDGNYTFRQGFSKTHELWLAPASSPHVSTLVADPPVVSCPPDYVEKTGVLRGLAVAARDQFPGYDEALKAAAEVVPAARLAKREFGMMNFGDWYGERVWNWGNLEYDAAHGMLTQFARTGEAVFFHRATEAARHQGDVDTRHYASDDRRIGQQWTHCMGHTAGYYDNTYKDMKVYAGTGWSDNRGHIWAQGLFEHFLWGGDRRSWEPSGRPGRRPRISTLALPASRAGCSCSSWARTTPRATPTT